MKTAYKQILFLYFRNSSFLLLFGVFLVTAFLSKVFYRLGYGYYAEEVFTLLFVVSLWLAFHLGILIKRQFSTYRASLLPRYRAPHINFMFAVYLVFIFVAYLWEFGLRPTIEISAQGLWGVYLTCLLTAMLITYLGYLSIGRLLMYAYVILLIFSHEAFNVISILNNTGYLVYVIAAACMVFVLFFRNRLLNLKDDHFEYGHIFSWPPHSFIIGQLKANERIADIFSPLARLLQIKKRITDVPKYPRTGNIFSRAYHWDYTEHTDFKVIWVLILLLAPLFLLFASKQPAWHSFSEDVYSNFLLLAISPVLIAMGTNYKRIACWGYDLLKPVNKQEYMKEQAIILFANLFLYWLLFTVCFAILPNIIFHPELFSIKKFWGYLALTANVSFIVLCWVALLSCVLSPVRVIANGLVLSLIVMFYFYFVPKFSFEQMLYHNLICFVGTMFLLSKAYQSWCEKEFLE